ncbi:TonB-dependent siderophore receptor [Mucilaginibacter sp. UR6-11]|uniref:TonB-dependent receptor plug domain-containing protein n=1 Tax=Mucilaginibacter sp. UR6-11 TaxID=1435644 RepID=UPI001E3DA684|nr:TonB-dependent receptor plug domain-containing protein [Mucilaginibacter sp. UR6-11]MCC8426510.1 TonB-dependent receptor [Mucilaginibacter sp. UR6-11]
MKQFYKTFLFLLALRVLHPLCAVSQTSVDSQQNSSGLSVKKIKKLSIEELMNIEVTSVSKRPEKLSEVASAIQIITQEDIHRSGATNLPEALRLSPNLQVAQYNSYAWIISARGFNNVFSNKLLVLIDGRTVYSPLFAGVYWDAQSVPLEDVDRIEIISGPGGTIWGANAVNGVINIITKKAKDTQGLYLSAAAGRYLHDQFSARYGGNIGSAISYRIYGLHNQLDQTLNAKGQNNTDNWYLNQGGLRVDYDAGGANKLSFQGNAEGGTEHTSPGPSSFDHQDIMGQWSHTFSPQSDLQVQAYYDRMWRRDLLGTINDQLETYDIDLQHHVQLSKDNNLLWGAGYRLMRDNSQNTSTFVGFVPAVRNLHLYSGFIQDEIQLVPDAFKLTIGTKLLHNDYSGFEIQPSVRLAWTPVQQQTVWASISHAVRTPSRIDVDYHIPTYPVAPSVQNVGGGPNFTSEKLIAYELGYRVQANQKLSLSIATFYNQYDDLYSVEVVPGTLTYLIQNGMKGNSEGAELTGMYQATASWRLRGGYTFYHKNIEDKPGHTFDVTYEGTDPQNQVMLQSMLDLFKHFQFDVVGRFVSGRPRSVIAGIPAVNGYANLDVRVAWQYKSLELSVAGQNIANPNHVEFAANRIPRNIYGKIAIRF